LGWRLNKLEILDYIFQPRDHSKNNIEIDKNTESCAGGGRFTLLKVPVQFSEKSFEFIFFN